LALNGRAKAEIADPEVVARAKRRQFTVAEKLRILDEVDRCEAGQIGAVLRREGLYSSHLSQWQQQRAAGQLQGLSAQKRGRKADAQAVELSRIRRENERLKARLEQAETIIEVQKKLYQLLGLASRETELNRND
jgi:transposase